MTIAEIITEIIKETGGDTDDTDLSSLWLTFVTAAVRRLPESVRTRALCGVSSSTLASGSRLIAKPTGFEYPKNCYRSYDLQRVPLTYAPDSTFNTYYREESGAPQFYRTNGAYIEFEILADQAYTIGMDYYKDISSSITTGDTLDRKLIEPVKELAKMIYYMDYEEDPQGKDIKHQALGADLLNKIESRDMESELGSHVSDE